MCIVLDCASQAQLSWQVDPVEGNITLELQGVSQGWLGMGLSPGSGMASADLNIAWLPNLVLPAAGTVRDYHGGASNGMPTLDARQNNAFVSSSFNATSRLMAVRWTRALVTGDPDDKPFTPGTPQSVLWAISAAPGAVQAADGSVLLQHDAGTRGAVTINFGAHSVCAGACPGTQTRYQQMRPQCLANGWTPAEAAGDRDGGLSRPRVTNYVTRTEVVPTVVPVPILPGGSNSTSSGADATAALVASLDAISNPNLVASGGALSVAWNVDPATSWAYFQVATLLTGGWAAVGFNPAGAMMVGSDIVVTTVVPLAPGALTCAGVVACATCCAASVANYHATALALPPAGPLNGGPSDVVLVNASVTAAGYSVVTFRRPVAALPGATAGSSSSSGASSRLLLAPGGGSAFPSATAFLVWAFGTSPALGMHSQAGGSVAPVTVAYNSSGTTASVTLSGSGGGLYALHGACMVLAFWGMMVAGAGLARYRHASAWLMQPAAAGAYKVVEPVGTPRGGGCRAACLAKQRWFLLHVLAQTLAMVLLAVGLAGVARAKLATPGGQLLQLQSTHSRVALAAVVLACAQYLLGAVRPPVGKSPIRRAWLIAHRLVAACALAVGSAAIFLGVARAGLAPGPVLAVAALHVACCVATAAVAEGTLACPRASRRLVVATAAAAAAPVQSIEMTATSPPVASTPTPAAPRATVLMGAPLPTRSSASGGGTADEETFANPAGWKLSAAPAIRQGAGTAATPAPHVGITAAVLALGGITAAILIAVLAGLIGAAGTSNSIVITADSVTGGSGGNRLRQLLNHVDASAAASSSRSRELQGSGYTYVTVNVTRNVTEAVISYIDAYPGGERDLCFGMQNFSVPPVPTSYACRGFALPRNVNLSAVEFEMLVDNSAVTHHVVAFITYVDYTFAPEAYPALGAGVFDCLQGVPPSSGVAFAWAVGMEAFPLPPGVGLRVGMPNNLTAYDAASLARGIPYLFLQFHYSNPAATPGLVDSSVLRVHVTDAVAPINSGMLWLGVQPDPTGNPAGSIPPTGAQYGQEVSLTLPWDTTPASVVNPLTSNYTVFGLFLHMHLLGQRIWVETTRGGAPVVDRHTGDRQLPTNDDYSFATQTMVPVANATLLPGDTVTTRCVHLNSAAYGALVGNPVAAAGRPVLPGEGTSNEMCMAFLMYYPALPGYGGETLLPAAAFCGNGTTPACSAF